MNDEIDNIMDEFDDHSDIFGYVCLGCGSTFGPEEVKKSDPCPECGALCLDVLTD